MFPLGAPARTDPADLSAYILAELSPQRFASYLQDRRITVLLVEIESILAGYLMLAREHTHAMIAAEHPVEIQKVYVDPGFQGRGIGDCLMREGLAQIFVHGAEYDVIWLSVHSENQCAIMFYRKYGFEIVGKHQFVVGSDPQDDFVMRLSRG